MFKKTLWAVSLFALCVSCTKSPKKNRAQRPSKELGDRSISASAELFASPLIQSWISNMDSPFLNISSDQLKELCERLPVSLEIVPPLNCQESIDLAELNKNFEASCESITKLSLELNPKLSCTRSVLTSLKQKSGSGPLYLNSNRLEPNVNVYPMLSQIPPIVFASENEDLIEGSPKNFEMPSARSWLRTMGPNGAVSVSLKPIKDTEPRLESLARSLSELESPKSFAPQIKFSSTSTTTSSALNLAQTEIKWGPTINLDKKSEKICSIVTGWIDYRMLTMTREPIKNTFELRCDLSLDHPILAHSTRNNIEIGKISFPMVLSKSGTYPFTSLLDSLSPSALLGLRLDL
jgi:hypothetical protein